MGIFFAIKEGIDFVRWGVRMADDEFKKRYKKTPD
jgi:hypothetical protein